MAIYVGKTQSVTGIDTLSYSGYHRFGGYMNLSEGQHWGALTVGHSRFETVKIKTGVDNAVTETRRVHICTLQCQCGTGFDVDDTTFTSKRLMRDCGCGAGNARKRGTIFTIYLPADLVEPIAEHANRNYHGVKSRAVANLLYRGLDSIAGL